MKIKQMTIKKGTYNEDGLKWCNKCKDYIDPSLFCKNGSSKDGLNYSCENHRDTPEERIKQNVLEAKIKSDEAIMLDSLGYVAECTGDNIFVVKNGHLYTPPQCMGTLRGITRDSILEIARKNKIAAHEHVITRDYP